MSITVEGLAMLPLHLVQITKWPTLLKVEMEVWFLVEDIDLLVVVVVCGGVGEQGVGGGGGQQRVACGGREQGVDRRAVQVPVRALVVPRERGARARHLVLVVAGGGGGQGRGLFGSGGREGGGSGRGGLGVARPILAWIP